VKARPDAQPDRTLPADALSGPVVDVARALLGRDLLSRVDGALVRVRLTEVEAYAGLGDDVASHAHRGRTPRNGVMFGPPGHVYVYRAYGLHWMLNLVCEGVGSAAAVLVRAGRVLDGSPAAAARRGLEDAAAGDRRLARGPANLAQALGVTGGLDGELLGAGGVLELRAGRPVQPQDVASGPRVGLGADDGRPWRFWVRDDETVTAWRAGGRRQRASAQASSSATT